MLDDKIENRMYKLIVFFVISKQTAESSLRLQGYWYEEYYDTVKSGSSII